MRLGYVGGGNLQGGGGGNEVTKSYVDTKVDEALNTAKKYTDERISSDENEVEEKIDKIIKSLTITRI